jgi:hypothetical protein
MAKYYVGDSPKFRCEFRVDGTLTDPTTVTLKLYRPNGTTDTYTYGGGTITKDSTGIFSKVYTLSSEGTWRWKWEGTGTAAAARAGTIFVEDTPFDT